MARQHTTFQNLKSIGSASLVGFGLVVLAGRLDRPAAAVMCNLLDAATWMVLKLLACIVPAAWQAVQTYVFGHQSFSPCPLEMLVSFWPLLHVLAGAA